MRRKKVFFPLDYTLCSIHIKYLLTVKHAHDIVWRAWSLVWNDRDQKKEQM